MSESRSIVVLGGGVAGLAAAYYLSRDGHRVTIVERAPVLGGLCASFESHGFTLDHGPHKMYSIVPGVLEELERIMEGRLLKHEKKNRLRLLDRFLDYPLSMRSLLPALGPLRSMRMGLDYAMALTGGVLNSHEPRSYEDYVLRRFGRSVYELVFEPLAWKVWGDPKTLAAELAAARIPSGGTTELILRLLKLKENTPDVDAPYFYYPRKGFGDFPRRLAELIHGSGGRILKKTTPTKIQRDGARVRAVEVDGDAGTESLSCDLVVSSIPIHALAELLHPGDREVDQETASLRFRQLILVYLVLEHDRLLNDHWIFFPERKFPFSRLFEQKALSEELGPAGKTVVCCDMTCELDDATWKASDEELVGRCLDSLVDIGLTSKCRFLTGFTKRFRDFYPVYAVDYRETLGRVYRRLQVADNLVLTGRLGMFNYNNSDHCLDMGRFIARGLANGNAPTDIWNGLEERVRSYRIVD